MAKRNGSEGGALDPALSQKKRARRRLIGAAALVLAAAIILPLVLDSEPRQQLADVEVEIPSRDTPLPPPTAQQDVAAGDAVTSSPGTPAIEPPGPAPTLSKAVPPATPAPAAARPPEPAQVPVPPSAPAQSPARPAQSSPAKSAAVLPKTAPVAPKPPASVDGRVVLQIAAYANPDSAKTMMERARKAGVRAFTETVQTPAGPRTRVRVGPFTDRESAERARGKLKLVGIDSTVMPHSP